MTEAIAVLTMARVDVRRLVNALLSPATAAIRRQVRVTVGLSALTILLLTLAFPPVGQFYFAWVALAPWLLAVRRCNSQFAAFAWSWATGFAFFAINMWWMSRISVPGYLALMVYCGIYWGFAALVIRGAGLLELRTTALLPERLSAATSAVLGVILIAACWTASEFARGNLMTGLPFLFIAHSQTTILPMCQIADVLGAYGVSFWVLSINAVVAITLLHRRWKIVLPSVTLVALLVLWTLVYGLFRMRVATTPGPTIMVVQANEPQSNNGQKSVEPDERVRFHILQTEAGLDRALVSNVDMVVWSETMMPELNSGALRELRRTHIDRYANQLEIEKNDIKNLAVRRRISILTGAEFKANLQPGRIEDGRQNYDFREKRNSAFLIEPDGSIPDGIGERYDKIHLVPFGEFIPFKHSVPWIYGIFLKLGPAYYDSYDLADGTDNGLTVFSLRDSTGKPRWKFVTPICFEDIDGRICSAMFRPDADGKKRADFIINLTNDGWFGGGENADHLQAAIFRSIENRVPTARSVNTGISGFIDSSGHATQLIRAGTEGASTWTLQLDDRLTWYTRYGDGFAWLCVALSLGATAFGMFGITRRPYDPSI